MKSEYDLVILGGGASGLLLADRLIRDPYYQEKKILLVEKDPGKGNDRTWCFWESGEGIYDDLLFKKWDEAVFKSPRARREFSLAPYTYKMLRSGAFYDYIHQRIRQSSNVEIRFEEVCKVEDKGRQVEITLVDSVAYAGKCFSSVRDLKFLSDHEKFPLVQQHFLGWFVETEEDVFNPEQVTLMDFSVPQRDNTRFMYVLPESPRRALLEYTLFSPEVLERKEYESAIADYLQTMGVNSYKVLETEVGNIPMSAYPFHSENTSNLMYIGTAGGWTKASTGYTFHNAMEKTGELAEFLKTNPDLRAFRSRDRFDFYDRVFLDVLFSNNALGSEIFSRMFMKGQPSRILKFLDNRTSFSEEISILYAMPKALFLKTALKQLF